MNAKPWNPLRLDVPAFARAGAELAGEWPATELPRLAEVAADEAPATAWPPARWRLVAEERPVRGGEAEIWLHLQIDAEARPTCQRCLKPVQLALQVDRPFRFVRDEAQAAELDAASDDDVLVLSRHFDTREWMEDELLLALPIVPLHEECPEPLPLTAVQAVEEPEDMERPNPFAALQVLKRSDPGSS